MKTWYLKLKWLVISQQSDLFSVSVIDEREDEKREREKKIKEKNKIQTFRQALLYPLNNNNSE